MLFTHSSVLPLSSERAGRYDMTRLREKHPKFLKISAPDERQYQCFMQDGNHFFVCKAKGHSATGRVGPRDSG